MRTLDTKDRARRQARRGVATKTALALLIAGGSGCGKDTRPATWEYISPIIFQPDCATSSCHSPAAAVSGLDFSDPEHGYVSLTKLWVWIVDPDGTVADGCKPIGGTVACQRNQRSLVVPFDPSQSRLVSVLRAQNAPRMPPDRPLAEGDIELGERWILQGAPRTVGGPPAGTSEPQDAGADGQSDGQGGGAGQGGVAGARGHGGAAGAPGSTAGAGGGQADTLSVRAATEGNE